MATVKRLFVFDDEVDADLLAGLDQLTNGEKSGVVRAALREYFQLQNASPNPTLSDVIERLDILQDDVAWLRRNGVPFAADAPGSADDDDPALLAALLDLGR
ncbi:MAG: hypothetical protein Kow0031_02730 [Anaerolineae bacterium]